MKKIISILLSVLLMVSSMFSIAQTVSAAGGSWAIQVSRSYAEYSDYDWSALGENLIPDPTVSHFDVGGQYGRYAKFDSGYNPVAVNQYYWWDKYIDREYGFKRYINDLVNGGNINLSSLTQDANGYYELVPGTSYGKPSGTLTFNVAVRSPMNWAAIKKNSEYASLTADGSGVLRFSTAGAWRTMPLPAMEAGKYYVVKFNMKSADSKNGSLELCLQFDNGNSDLGTNAATVTLGSGLTNGKTDTIAFVVSAGTSTYSDPFIKFYCRTETFFDDFGMYEVSEEFANAQTAGTKLTAPPVETIDPVVFQTAREGSSGNGAVLSYTGFDWSLLGENLVPDPTVAHFENGVYGKYATPDAQWKPENINPYYWWDKYFDEYLGFTMFYQDMEDGTRDGNVGGVTYRNGFQSLANRNLTKTEGSLTDDGSGVIQTSSGGGYRGAPLPALEADKYYVIKLNVKCASQMDSAIELCLSTNGTSSMGDVAAGIDMGSGFANGKANTACFVIYTGSLAYSDPFVKTYCQNSIATYFDDFGVYEVSEEYAKAQSVGVKLTGTSEPVEVIPATVYQTTRSNTEVFNYSEFDWSAFGENLVPDPTVAHFDADGKYGRYAKIDANYNPVGVNPYYFWDKASDMKYGFTDYYKDLAEHDKLDLNSLPQDINGYYELEAGKCYGAPDRHADQENKYLVDGVGYDPMFRSPLNFTTGVTTDTAYSLTDDGSGVLKYTGSAAGSRRYIPLPAMEADSYYIIKFRIKCDVVNNYNIDFFVENKSVDEPDAVVQMGSAFEAEKVYTVSYLVYTGSKMYDDPFIRVYLQNCAAYFDDFGVYRVTEEYAALCSNGAKLHGKDHVASDDWASDENGHWQVCVDCGGAISEPAAHTESNWIIDTEATAEAAGHRHKECTVCGYVTAEEDIEQLVSTHEPGDVNGDGSVNNKDLTRLFQYLSDWPVEVNEPALDINGDGRVNNKDLTRLFQYLSDWDVEIF